MNQKLKVITLLAMLSILCAAMAHAAPKPKVTICHFPPGNPANWHTITISENALQTHQNRHGDLIDIACEDASCDQLCGDGDVCTQDVLADVDDCLCIPEPRPQIDCDDSNPCTVDSCVSDDDQGCVNTAVPNEPAWPCMVPEGAGVCVDGLCEVDLCADVVCDAPDQCQDAGTCNPDSGMCEYPPADDGTTCDDGDPSTTDDQCSSGICEGEPDLCFDVSCAAPDQCELPGTCDPATGLCEYQPADDGTTCDDGDPSTTGDQCSSGICEGEPPVGCQPDTICVTGGGEDGVCDAQGMCVAQCDIGIAPTGSCSVPGEMRQSRDSCGEFAECVFFGFGYVWQPTPCLAGEVWDDVAGQCQATSITCTYADGACGTGGPD